MKKIIISLLTVSLFVLLFPLSTGATEDKTVFYLDYGNVTIGDGSVSGYDESGNLISETNPAGYVVTQKNPKTSLDKGITVASGEQKLELKNINIYRKDENAYAFCILKGATADITLSGESRLMSGTYRAGMDVAIGATAIIGGDGILNAQSFVEAGIGGGNGRSNGTVIINSGTVYASGGLDGSGAGIGGGSMGNGGNITINGGYIVATGGKFGAGIGGGNLSNGGNITINGGTVTAIGGDSASGIGGGFTGKGGNIVINGGSVKATAGSNADSIGNGYKCNTAFDGIHNNNGNEVSLVTVPLSDYKSVYLNGINKSPITAGHIDDSSLYLYSDINNNIATAYMSDDSVKFFIYSKDGYYEINPFDEGERFENCLIVKDSENFAVSNDFTIENNGGKYSLCYNEAVIDTFAAVEKGDLNRDGKKDGTDAVEALCVLSGMNTSKIAQKLADADDNGKLTSDDIELLINEGIY